MNDLVELEAKTVNFWLIGGTGVNLGRSYRNDQPSAGNEDQLASEKFAFIDTSFNNLAGASKAELLVINDGKGLGKDQEEGLRIFNQEMPNIKAKFEPGKVNVVVVGTSGGTGSTGGRKIIEWLLEKGETVVAILVSSHDSDRSTLNTIGFIKNLQKAIKKFDKPLAAYYYKNDRTIGLSANNTAPLFVMRLLSIFGSGKNAHLDESDVRNFFNFTSTRHPAALSLLQVFAGEDQLLAKVTQPVTGFAALLKGDDELVPQIDTAYDTVGYLPTENRKYDNSFFFTVSAGGFNPILDELKKDLEKYQRESQAVVKTSTLLSDDDDLDGDDIVLK